MKSFSSFACASVLAASMLALSVPSAQAASSDGRDRRITVYNNTDVTIWEFYASNVSRDKWEEDVLTDSVIRSGDKMRFNLDDGTNACRFDLKVVFKDGVVVTKKDFNVCTESSWTLTN